MENKENIIVTLTFKFALDIIKYCESLQDSKKFVVANQLLKSGTSIDANIREAQNAEAKPILFINLKSQLRKLKKQFIV
jgi:four helix bundle protein